MSLAMSVQFPATTPITCHPNSSAIRKPTAVGGNQSPFRAKPQKLAGKMMIRRKQSFWATGDSEPETAKEAENDDGEKKAELSELGSQIKKAMEERKAAEKGKEEEEGLLDGVSEEIRKIEWPAFGKVLGTTWVVLGVIAGSSVVLLTLNFVLAELSDKVFAGRGVQDFFS